MNFLSLLEAKREGKAFTDAEISFLIRRYTAGDVPDYQMASLLMAILFRGLNSAETRAWTLAMRDSGEVLRFPEDPKRPLVDKHSTGGVGDKVSLVLAPSLACLGFRVPMISGRGLGITGGTLDKLESVPGFRTALSAQQIIEQVQSIGCVICGQTERMVPADRSMYALRDVTGTVPSIPLITGSILSKKLAEGIHALVLDVKYGSAAFMERPEQAAELAGSMVQLGNECGVNTRALLTDMSAPLGRAAGNWLEVKEAVGCLEGKGPADLEELVIECAASLLVQTRRAADLAEARRKTSEVLQSRGPLEKWNEMLAAQGANRQMYQERLARDSIAEQVVAVRSVASGFVHATDARILGEIVRDLGGGRLQKDSRVKPEVGIDQIAKPGERIERGDLLCRVHVMSPPDDVAARVTSAFVISEKATTPRCLIQAFSNGGN